MKNTILLPLLLLLSAFGFSQDKFIEISVSETIELKATAYVYTISNYGEERSTMSYLFDYDEETEEYETREDDKDRTSIDDVAKALTRDGYTFTRKNNSDAENDSDSEDMVDLEVTVNTKQELEKLISIVEDFDYTYGSVTDTKYESIELHHAAAFKTLMQKAKDKGTLLALAAGKKVGEVLQITEGSGGGGLFGDNFDWSNYMETILSSAWKLNSDEAAESKSVDIKMTYRFALID